MKFKTDENLPVEAGLRYARRGSVRRPSGMSACQ
jgi:hypothetical protein